MATTLETIRTRSSIRGYKDEALTKEQIDTLIEAALLAPTAANAQELHFTVADTTSDIVKELTNDFKPDFAFHYGARTLIIISGADEFPWTGVDAGIAVENIHLAAADMGLGSVIIGCIAGVLTGEKKAYYDEKFAIPAGYSYKVAIAVGVPTVTKEPHEVDCAKNVTIL